MDILLHPPDERDHTRSSPRGRLSTVGHGTAFRAFVRAARRVRLRFMVIGGTFRDVAVRAASTRDIDVVLVDREAIDPEAMAVAGFRRVPGARHAWRYGTGDRVVELQVAAIASSTEARGPFSVAFQHAQRRVIEGARVAVPRVEDWVILKLIAAADDPRRRHRDLADVQHALDAFPRRRPLRVAALRARLRELYGITGAPLKELIGLLRQVRRPA